jgi:uncharacterized secreted protein with C-terminal beta-propeller domain
MMLKRLYLPVLLLGFIAIFNGCSGNDEIDHGDSQVPRNTSLNKFADCRQLADYLVDSVGKEAGLQAMRYEMSDILPEDAAAPTDSPVAGSADSNAPLAYTTTNVQETGVDEADFVKTDGNFLYLLREKTFLIFKSWPAAEAGELSRLELEGNPFALFLEGNHLAIISHQAQSGDPTPVLTAAGFAPEYQGALQLELYDVTDRTQPRLLRKIDFEGRYVDARAVAGDLHLVLSSGGGPLVYPLLADDMAATASFSDVTATNMAVSVNRVLESFPAYSDTLYSDTGATAVSEPLCACEDVYYPTIPNGSGLVTLYSLDLTAPTSSARRVSVLSDSGVVYASTSSLYLATTNDNNWLWNDTIDDDNATLRSSTIIHRFSLADNPLYQGSGEVPGWVLNRFSLGEFNDSLSIATTEPRWVTGTDPANRVFTLALKEGELTEQGRLENLGKPGETIFAVRFLGERGYVVTFEQTDPLYVLDLADPLNPQISGELEVPGFSTYLHPLEGDRLLAVGRDPVQNSLKLSLFDVADPTNPLELATRSEDYSSYSSAEYEPHAFTYDPHSKVLALPFTGWEENSAAWNGYRLSTGLQLYDIEPAAAAGERIAHRGFIDHSSFYRDYASDRWYAPRSIERSFIASDETNSYLYSISGRGLQVNDLNDLDTPLKSFDLPAERIYWDESLVY